MTSWICTFLIRHLFVLKCLFVDAEFCSSRDSNRMDSGRFESVSRPYSFHQVLRGLLVPLRLATDARQLELVTDLDPCIDKVCLSHPYVLSSPILANTTRDL
jgi:hypothetical protein